MGRRLRPFPKNGTPGEGYRRCICDSCKFQIRLMDCVLVTDPLQTAQRGLLVCKWCRDEVNPQIKTRVIIDKPVSDPKTVRIDDGGVDVTPGEN